MAFPQLAEVNKYNNLKSMKQVGSNYVNTDQWGNNNSNIVPTGFKCLNKMIKGFRKSELVLIIGSWQDSLFPFFLKMAYGSAKYSKTAIGYVSVGMSFNAIKRLLSRTELNIPHKQSIDLASLNNKEKQILKDITESKLVIDDSIKIRDIHVFEACIDLRTNEEVEAIYLDLIQENKLNLKHKYKKDFIRTLKVIAKALDIPIILCSQVEATNKEEAEDFSSDHGIMKFMDKVIKLYRPFRWEGKTDELGNNVLYDLEINVIKNREGPIGDCKLYFDPMISKLEDII